VPILSLPSSKLHSFFLFARSRPAVLFYTFIVLPSPLRATRFQILVKFYSTQGLLLCMQNYNCDPNHALSRTLVFLWSLPCPFTHRQMNRAFLTLDTSDVRSHICLPHVYIYSAMIPATTPIRCRSLSLNLFLVGRH
jgi:hypothetical protein